MNKRILNNRSFKSHSEEDFVKVFNNIGDYVSKDHIDYLIDITVNEIRDKLGSRKAAYAWSGGKDSVALALVCELAGINNCMIGLSGLEYPVYLEWLKSNSPKHLKVIETGQDLEWLVKHPNMLFPEDNKVSARWYKIVQQEAQRIFFAQDDLDIIILGRRKADSNYVGRNGDNIYTNKDGTTRYSPISNWSHEEVLAAIRYYNLPIAPFYSMPNAFFYGTHPWPARERNELDKLRGSYTETWKEIRDIDRSIVEKASVYFPDAKGVL